MQTAKRIQAFPLDLDSNSNALFDFKAERTIRTEYTQLVEDHSNLIQEGSSYMDWDPSDKLSFLDRIETMEQQWEDFFSRFQLNELVLNQDYVDQCRNYLSCMKLTEDEYRRLGQESHRLMRQEAQRDRDRERD